MCVCVRVCVCVCVCGSPGVKRPALTSHLSSAAEAACLSFQTY